MSKLPSAKEELARMNDEHVVVKIGGKVRIAGWEMQDAGSGRKIQPYVALHMVRRETVSIAIDEAQLILCGPVALLCGQLEPFCSFGKVLECAVPRQVQQPELILGIRVSVNRRLLI